MINKSSVSIKKLLVFAVVIMLHNGIKAQQVFDFHVTNSLFRMKQLDGSWGHWGHLGRWGHLGHDEKIIAGEWIEAHAAFRGATRTATRADLPISTSGSIAAADTTTPGRSGRRWPARHPHRRSSRQTQSPWADRYPGR